MFSGCRAISGVPRHQRGGIATPTRVAAIGRSRAGKRTDPPSLIASEPLFSLAGATQVLTEALATYNLPTIYSTIFAQFAAAAALNVSYSMLCDPSDLSEIARITTNGVLFR